MTTAATRGAISAVSAPVPVPTSSTTSLGRQFGPLDDQPLQVQVDQKVLAVARVEPDARLGKPPRQVARSSDWRGRSWKLVSRRCRRLSARPAIAAIVSSRRLLLGVLGQQVGFQIDAVADAPVGPASWLASVCGISATLNRSRLDVDQRQADAVDGDRALGDHVAAQCRRKAKPERRPVAIVVSLGERGRRPRRVR